MPRKKPPDRRAYDTDLSDGQWAPIEPMMPGGRPRKAAERDFVDAILYFLRSGGGWRLLPGDPVSPLVNRVITVPETGGRVEAAVRETVL